MVKAVFDILIPTALIGLSLLFWQFAQPLGDSMLVLLLPLAVLLFMGHARLAQQTHRAGQRAIWQEKSWLPRIMTGRISAVLGATLFTAVSMPLLAWGAATMSSSRLWLLPAGTLLAATIYTASRRRLGRHLHDPFDRRGAIRIATLLTAIPIVAIEAWHVFNVDVIPVEVQTARIGELPRVAWRTLPVNDSILSTIMFPLHLLDTFKLWIAAEYPERRWLGVIVSLDAALFGFVTARTAAVVADRLQPIPHTRPSTVSDAARMRSRVFWGTIGGLMMLTLSLQIIGARSDQKRATAARSLPEVVTEKLEEILGTVSGEAAEAVADQIDPMVEAAFSPVYDRIPGYVDFHYSLAGEYTELLVKAARELEIDMESRLFSGLSEELQQAAERIDTAFLEEYRRRLTEQIHITGNSIDLGNALGVVLDDAVARAMVTKPVAAGAGIAGVGGVKLLSKAVAKKIGAKLATKFAAKGAVKGGSVLTGMGSGAAVCGFAGPAAIACIVAGGVVTWVIADMAMIKIDEVMNRDEFEADLRKSVDEEKKRITRELRQGLFERAAELHRIAPQQARDATLSTLSKPRQKNVCEVATELMGNYILIRDRIAARSHANLAAFSADLEEASSDDLLAPMARQMRSQIDAEARKVTVSSLNLKGNFRTDDRAKRKVSALIRLNGETVDLQLLHSDKDRGFFFRAPPGASIDLAGKLDVAVALEQQRRWPRSNRFYGARAGIKDLFDIPDAKGLKGKIVLPLHLARDKKARDLASTGTPSGPTARAELTLWLEANPLADPLPLGACAE